MKKLASILLFGLFASTSFAQETVEIPNSFTPNKDGVNDFFEIRTTGYSNLKCSIFNRYGSLVYEFYGLKGSWDGYTHAGMECTEGVYFVILELVDESGETKSFQGDLQLFK